MYSQAYARTGRTVTVRALPSVIVGTEKVSTGSGWLRVKARGEYQQCAHRWKGGRFWVHLERAGEAVRSPKITSGDNRSARLTSQAFDLSKSSHM